MAFGRIRGASGGAGGASAEAHGALLGRWGRGLRCERRVTAAPLDWAADSILAFYRSAE